MNWSRITETELGKAAWDILDSSRCAYHNGWHVIDMYKYLEQTNEPYDECLDWAVLFHDIVYDDKPEKEYRSAVKFSDMKEKYSGCNLNLLDEGHVASLILATEKHYTTYPSYSAIVRADLHALTSPLDTFYNFQSIMSESMYLYKIDEVTFADNNIKFMSDLYKRVDMNVDLDSIHRDFYKDVKRGIVSTINLSRILKGDL
jgi:predicted metal-dependent HD superfamily phosphohydrolase